MEYRLLGPLEVLRDGRPVELGGRKQRAVLAILLLEAGRVVPTDRLIRLVWGDDPPPSVTGSLHAYVSNLRRALRDDHRAGSPIVRRAPGYLLEKPAAEEDFDLPRFVAGCDATQAALDAGQWSAVVEHAQQTLSIARGPLAVEWADEEWVVAPAAVTAERRMACEQNLIVGLLGQDRVGAALARSRTLVADQPLSERACWLHMVTLYRSGRTAEALDAYTDHSKRLDDELGLDPGAPLRDLQGAVLRQDDELTSWPNRVGTSSAPPVIEPGPDPVRAPAAEDTGPAADGSSVPAADQLVGRHHELDVLRSALRDATVNGPTWIVLTGPAGMGKTRLAEEAVAFWQSTGGRLLRARCPDDDATPPWWPIRQMLLELGETPEQILTPPGSVDADEARFTIYDRIRGVVGRVTRQTPMLIMVDDVHWADPASLRFMRYVAEAEQRLDLAVVITVRDGEGGPETAKLLAAVARRRGSRHLALPPLTATEVATLAEQIGGSPLPRGEVEQLARRTQGNPFFVSEYARLPEADRFSGEVPVAIRSVLGRRLAGLDPATLQVLRTAAILGDPLDLDLLAAVTRLDPDELADLLDEAADERIIVPAPGEGTYTFAHALLRDEVIAAIPALRRQRLHLKVAETIGPSPTGDRLARRAAHLVAALPVADAADTMQACRAAALAAEREWQYDAAAQWWGMALRAFDLLPTRLEPPVGAQTSDDAAGDAQRDELIIAQVSALAHNGRGQTVLDVVEAALFEAIRQGRTGSAGRLAATLLRATGSWPWVVYGSDPGPLLTRLAGIEDLVRNDPAAHARILAALAVGSCYDPDENVPDVLSLRAIELAESIGDPDVLADALLGRMLTRSGVAAYAQETVDLGARLAALPHRLARVDDVLRHNLLSMAELTLGRAAAAAEHVRQGEVGSDLLRMPVSRAQFRWAAGTNALWHGDTERAESLYDHAYQMHRETELYVAGSNNLAMLALRWNQGRMSEITLVQHPAVAKWVELFMPGPVDSPELDASLAAEIDRPEPVNWLTHSRLTLLAHTIADRRLVALASPLRRRLEPIGHLVATVGQVGVIGTVALALGRLAALDNDLVGARQHLAVAVDLARSNNGAGELRRCRQLSTELDQLDQPFSR